MNSEPYSKKILSALSQLPKGKPTVEIDKDSSHNAAASMTALLCNRLATAGKDPENAGRTTYHWDDGTINIRNAVKPFLWTNLRLKWVKDFHELGTSRPAVYLMACWQPSSEILHVWAIPEPVMFDALPRHPIRQVKEKRTVQIKTNVHRFEQCDDSPDLQPYYRSLKLTAKEVEILNNTYKSDRLVKLQRSAESDSDSSTIHEAANSSPIESTPATPVSAGNPSPVPKYWAIGLGEGGRLWNECQEKGIIARPARTLGKPGNLGCAIGLEMVYRSLDIQSKDSRRTDNDQGYSNGVGRGGCPIQ